MSGSENMIERVARAICASDFDGDASVYDTMSEAMRENFTINARAAIEAMMEPNAQMECASYRTPEAEAVDWVNALFGTGISSAQEIIVAGYRAMLRSSLTGDSK